MGLLLLQTLWCSWVLEGPSKKIYFGGDTGFCTVPKGSDYAGGQPELATVKADGTKGIASTTNSPCIFFFYDWTVCYCYTNVCNMPHPFSWYPAFRVTLHAFCWDLWQFICALSGLICVLYVWPVEFPVCPSFAEIGNRFGPFDAAFLPIGAYSPRFFMSAIHCSPGDFVVYIWFLSIPRYSLICLFGPESMNNHVSSYPCRGCCGNPSCSKGKALNRHALGWVDSVQKHGCVWISQFLIEMVKCWSSV